MNFRFNGTCVIFVYFITTLGYKIETTKKLSDLNLEKRIDQMYLHIYENINEYRSDNVICIFDSNSRVVKHLELEKDSFAVVNVEEDCSSLTVCSRENILEFLNNQPKNRVAILFNTDNAEIVNGLSKEYNSLYFQNFLLRMLNFSPVNTFIYDIIQEFIKDKDVLDLYSDYAKGLGIYCERTGIVETLFVNINCLDFIYYVNSEILVNHEPLSDDKYRNLFDDFQNLFESSFKPDIYKMEWCDKILDNSFKLLQKYKILKRSIPIAQFPEVVSMLFPISFLNRKVTDEFESADMARFCISFEDIHRFAYFDEFFNEREVNDFQYTIGKIYFTKFINMCE